MAIFQGKASEIESNLNKVAEINSESTEIQYPSAKAVYDFGQCIMVTDTGTDLNDYKEQGVYFFGSNVTPVNIPVGVNGWLEVFHSTQHDQYRVVKQVWYRLGTPSDGNDYWTYVRSYTDNYGWGRWYKIQTDMTPVISRGDDYPAFDFRGLTNDYSFGGTVMKQSTRQIYFTERNADMDGASTAYDENYVLPAPATGLTADKWYNILTSKNPVTVAQGGTGATTAATARANLGLNMYVYRNSTTATMSSMIQNNFANFPDGPVLILGTKEDEGRYAWGYKKGNYGKFFCNYSGINKITIYSSTDAFSTMTTTSITAV